jgi:predicted transcriptional regulator
MTDSKPRPKGRPTISTGQAEAIRRKVIEEKIPAYEVAHEMGMSPSTVRKYAKTEQWRKDFAMLFEMLAYMGVELPLQKPNDAASLTEHCSVYGLRYTEAYKILSRMRDAGIIE